MSQYNGTARAKELIAGSDFSQIILAVRDDAEIPDDWREVPPDEWLDDLSQYDVTVQISTTPFGAKIVASTAEGVGNAEMIRAADYLLIARVSGALSATLQEGEAVLTIEMVNKETGGVEIYETDLMPVREARNIKKTL